MDNFGGYGVAHLTKVWLQIWRVDTFDVELPLKRR